MSRHNIHTLYFTDMAEAAHFARHTPRADMAPAESQDRRDHDWDLGFDLEESIECAEGTRFWDGVSTMMDNMEITDKLAAKADLPRVKRHLVGGSVSMGAYLSGHPKHMRRRSPQPSVDRPVLSIGVSLGIYWGTTAAQRLNMGAALMSAIDQLERNGYRCEVIAFWRASGTNNDPFKHWVNIEYQLKAPQSAWNPSALAFTIAHPAAQRHLTWRIAETQTQWTGALRSCYCSNINTQKYHESCAGDFDVYFGNMGRSESAECNTLPGAFGMVQATITDQMERAERAGRAA